MEANNIIVVVIILAVSVAGIFLILVFNQNQSPAGQLDKLLNKKSPEFSFSDIYGKNYSLEGLKGKNVVLFFNEGLGCYPACWNQVASFGSDARFLADDITAISVVMDSADEWKQVIDKMEGLDKAIIAIDKNGVASRKFGMLTLASSMHYGKEPGHTYVIIDKNGIVRYVLDDPRMAINNDQIFNEISKLNK